MHILSTVAERHHLGERVYSRSYAKTLLEYVTLRERDSIDEVITDSQRIADAGRTAVAFHEPEKLQREFDRLADRSGTTPTPEERAAENAAIRANADRLLERVAKHTARAG